MTHSTRQMETHENPQQLQVTLLIVARTGCDADQVVEGLHTWAAEQGHTVYGTFIEKLEDDDGEA